MECANDWSFLEFLAAQLTPDSTVFQDVHKYFSRMTMNAPRKEKWQLARQMVNIVLSDLAV